MLPELELLTLTCQPEGSVHPLGWRPDWVLRVPGKLAVFTEEDQAIQHGTDAVYQPNAGTPDDKWVERFAA